MVSVDGSARASTQAQCVLLMGVRMIGKRQVRGSCIQIVDEAIRQSGQWCKAAGHYCK